MLLAFAPAGEEFRVNTFTANNQLNPSVAADASGAFFVAWESALQDGSGFGIYAQRYGADGGRAGPEVRVNTTTFRFQVNASVAMDADGDFVVVWQNHENDFESDIFARRYNAGGTAQGGEIVVNTNGGGDQGRPAVAMSAGGDFVVAWESFLQDGDGEGVFARRYTADGVAAGGEIPVNTTTAGTQFSPAIATDARGDFVVAWKGPGGSGAETVATSARRFDSAGVPQGDEFVVASSGFGDSEPPALAMDSGGGFVIAWGTYLNQAGVFSGDVHARRYSAAGVPRAGEFVVNEAIPGAQTAPAAAIDADGEVIIAWTTYAADTGERDIDARRFDANGLPLGGDFRVNTAAEGIQTTPSVASDADGDCIVAWHSNTPNRSEFDVYARRYRAARPPAVTGVYVASSSWRPAFRSLLQGGGLGSAAFGASVPAAAQLRTVPWGGLDQVSISFSENMVVGSTDLAVRGVSFSTYPVTDFGYDPATRTATWRLGRSIWGDKILLDLNGDAGGVAAEGLPLDGEWTGNAGTPDAFPSGDGAPGGDFRFRINVLPGDVNGDRFVNVVDMLDVHRRRTYSPAHDVNGDAAVNAVDLARVRAALLSRLPAPEPVAGFFAARPALTLQIRRKLFTDG